MTDLNVRIVRLEPMRVAAALARGAPRRDRLDSPRPSMLYCSRYHLVRLRALAAVLCTAIRAEPDGVMRALRLTEQPISHCGGNA